MSGGNSKDRRKSKRKATSETEALRKHAEHGAARNAFSQAVAQQSQTYGPAALEIHTMEQKRPAEPRAPFYERNPFWACVTTAAGIILCVIAAMRHDVRWLLWFAWLLLCAGAWLAVRAIPNKILRVILAVVLWCAIGFGLYGLNLWLKPPDITTVASLANPPQPAETKPMPVPLAPRVSAPPPNPRPSVSTTPTARDQGLQEKTPDFYWVSLGGGGASAGASLEDIKKANVKLFSLGGYNPVKLRLIDGIVYCDVQTWGGPMGPPIKIVQNKLSVQPPFWDHNFNANALEVVDERGEPIFQFIRKAPDHFVINGLLEMPDRTYVLASDTGLKGGITSPVMPRGTLKPIFKYPAWKYPGQLAD